MKLRTIMLTAFLLAIPLSATAGDLGFRFNGTSCVDKAGKTGLNPSYMGQCGDLRKVGMNHLNFDGEDFSGAVFDGSTVNSTSFVGGNFTAASFMGTDLSGSDLTSAIVHQVNFNKAILANVHLAGADIVGSNFTGVDLSNVLFSTMKLSGNIFVSANFTGAQLDSADLSGSDLSHANFTGANLQSAKLDGAKFNSANCTTADFTGASMIGVTASSGNFAKSLLRKTNLSKANLISSDFRAAQMNQANLNKASLVSSDLRRAVLQDAVITEATFTGARISKATVLPITTDQALQLGMVMDSTVKLFVIYDSADQFFPQLIAGMQDLDIEVAVSHQSTSGFVGDEQLDESSAVLHLNSNDYNVDMPATGQAALVDFVKNGGVYISTGGAPFAVYYNQSFSSMADLILFSYQDNDNPGNQVLTAAQSGQSPLLIGMDSPITFTGVLTITAPMITFADSPSVAVLNDANGTPKVASRDLGSGHVVGLTMCQVQDDSCLANLNVQKMIANATRWQTASASAIPRYLRKR